MRSIPEILDSIDMSSHKNYNRENCLIYLKYMMWGAGQGEPEPSVEVHDYYRYIYKHVEMIWIEEAMEEHEADEPDAIDMKKM